MLGISYYSTQTNETYLETARKYGATMLFTSLLYAMKTNSVDALSNLIQKAHALGYEVIIDCNRASLSHITIHQLIEWQVDAIRFDELDDLTRNEIALVNNRVKIYLNASQLSNRIVSMLGLSKWHLIYNFYPLEHSGLDGSTILKTNQLLANEISETAAFIPGDYKLRGTLYKGLPTVEHHRYLHPLLSACELYLTYGINHIMIADEEAKESTLQALSDLINKQIIKLPVYYSSEIVKTGLPLIEVKLRLDNSATLFRSVKPENLTSKAKNRYLKKGTIFSYPDQHPYQGFIGIARKDVLMDDELLLIGFIHPYFTDIVDIDLSGLTLQFVDGSFYEF